MQNLMGGGLKFLKTTLFDNSRQENLGITKKEKAVSQKAIKSYIVGGATQQYTLTDAFATVTGMTITHESKTNKVLIIYSSTVSTGSIDGVGYSVVNQKLQKDGVDILGTENVVYIAPQGDENNNIPCTIHWVADAAEKNVWRIVGKKEDFGGANDSFIDDRVLTIIDL
jgi:hypothetical protein